MRLFPPHLTRYVAGIFALLATSLLSNANAASFDCKKASTPIEHAICDDPVLSALDDRMRIAYDTALKNFDRTAVRQSQRDWLRIVRNRCDTVECLRRAYSSRNEVLASPRPDDLSGTKALEGAVTGISPSQISYGPTARQNLVNVANWLERSAVLESTINSLKPYVKSNVLPSVIARECGKPSAHFISSLNQVHICYEFVEALLAVHGQQVRQGATAEEEQGRALLAIKFVELHEIGHALMHRNRGAGGMGPEEAEADNFAAVFMLSAASNSNEIREAVVAVTRLTTLFGAKRQYTWDEYADEHLVPEQRMASFACLAGGRDPSVSTWLTQHKVLPERRAQRCANEWTRTFNGVNTLLAQLK